MMKRGHWIVVGVILLIAAGIWAYGAGYVPQFSQFYAAAPVSWAPPIGIPMPPFGITNVAPAVPSPWTSNAAGFYYVQSGGTNTGNGFPGSPRSTIPLSLPAGSVVILAGTYTTNHAEGGSPIQASGTTSAPVYIRGMSDTQRPTITQKWQVVGSYYVIEYINATWANSSGNGKLIFAGDHGVVRHVNFGADTQTGGLYPNGSNMVIWDTKLHDFGDVNATFDQDNHCISVSTGTDHLFVLDNEIYHCSGDGIQINGGAIGNNTTPNHIYVGRNLFYGNKQSGFWTKSASDIIFSQNTAHSMSRTSGSSSAQCAGSQYGPDRVWFLYNDLYDCAYGINVGSDSGGPGIGNYYIGNVIHNIHGASEPTNSWGGAAIMTAGGKGGRVFVGNTIYDADAGINIPSDGTTRVADNIISGIGAGAHVWYDGGSSGSVAANNNILGGTAKLTKVTCATCTSADPKFVNASTGDFHLQSSSPAVNIGVVDPVYATFQSLYGLSIAVDKDGNARPVGSAWDVGAYEYGGVIVSTPTPVTTPVLTPTPITPTQTPVGSGAILHLNGTGASQLVTQGQRVTIPVTLDTQGLTVTAVDATFQTDSGARFTGIANTTDYPEVLRPASVTDKNIIMTVGSGPHGGKTGAAVSVATLTIDVKPDTTVGTKIRVIVLSAQVAATGLPVNALQLGTFAEYVVTAKPTSTAPPIKVSPPMMTAVPIASTVPAVSKAGDVNKDGKVDIFDYNFVVTNFAKTGSAIPGDLNKDGKVDIFDYNIVVSNFGK